MNLYNLVLPLGIVTYSLLTITLLLGVVKKIFKPQLRLRLHKVLAIITLILATVHGLIVILTKLGV